MTENVKPPRNKWGWIAFFVFVVVASIAVAATMIIVNLALQLKPEQLETSWERWREQKIKDYDMVYTETHTPGDKTMTFNVKVREGKVNQVLMNGKAIEKDGDRKDDPQVYHSMDALFRMMDTFMRQDTQPGATRVYVVAKFDVKTGGVRQYIRRVMGSTQRVEINVTKFERVEAP